MHHLDLHHIVWRPSELAKTSALSSSNLLICLKYCILAVWRECQMAVDRVMLITDPFETAVSLSLPQVPLVPSSLLSCRTVWQLQ